MIRAYWKPIVAGFIGMAVFFACWHLWLDHAALHQIIYVLNNAPKAPTGR